MRTSFFSLLLAALGLAACVPPHDDTPKPVGAASTAPSAPLVCPEGLGDCDLDRETGCEAFFFSRRDHCGACGHACGDAEACVAGECRPQPVTLSRGPTQRRCAVRADGSVWCWGQEWPLSPPAPAPVRVEGLPPARDVTVGGGRACALLRDASVMCWSDDGPPTAVPGVSAIALDVGWAGLRGLEGSGQVWWLERGKSTVERPSWMSDVVAFAGGCVVHRAGTVSCGRDAGGQPRRVMTDAGRELDAVVALDDVELSACAARRDGSVWCWKTAGAPSPAAQISGVTGAIGVAVGWEAWFAWNREGEVTGWGAGRTGAFGGGVAALFSEFEPRVGGLRDVAQVSSFWSTCAALRSGSVRCWGLNDQGGLGIGERATFPTPMEVAGVDGAVAIAAGGGFTCALLGSGRVSCWGVGPYSWLRGTERWPPSPRERAFTPTLVDGVARATTLVATGATVCAVSPQAGTQCWRGGLGPSLDDKSAANAPHHPRRVAGALSGLGLAETGPRREGLLVSAVDGAKRALLFSGLPLATLGKPRVVGSDIVSVTSDGFETFFLHGDGRVSCATNGDLVDDPSAIHTFTEVADGAAIAGDLYVMTRGGDVYERDALGTRSGDAPPLTKRELTCIRGGLRRTALHDVVKLSSHVEAGCALRRDGHVACWGPRGVTTGQQGDPRVAMVPVDSAIDVPGLVDAVDIADMGRYSCAVRANGKVVCWGINDHHDALGQPDRSFSLVAIDVLLPP